MGTRVKNMKVLMSGDSKPYQVAVAQAGSSTKRFKRDASGALGDVANAFGVNLGPITGFTNKYTASLKGVYGGLLKSKQGASVWSTAMRVIKTATLASGIGALVLVVVSLISYFTKTQRGADKLKQVFAGFGAGVDVLTDRLSGMGERFIKVFQDPKQAVADLWAFIKSQIVNRVKGIADMFVGLGKVITSSLKLDFTQAKAEMSSVGDAYIQTMTGLDKGQQKKLADGFKSVTNEIKAEAGAAANLEKQLQALRDKEIALETVQSARRKEMNRLRLEAEKKDKYSAEQRLAMLDKADKIEREKLASDKAMQAERVKIMEQQIALGESTADEYRALAEAKATLDDLDTQSLKLQRTLETKRQTTINEINAETAATAALIAEKNKLLGIDDNGVTQKLQGKSVEGGITAPAKLELRIDNEQLKADMDLSKQMWNDYVSDVQSSMIDLTDVINGTLNSAFVGIGEMLGSLEQNGGGFEAFGHVVATAFADMAVQVGKIAIAMGVAKLGIESALKNPLTGGLGAIAAGVALVALGTAVKGQLANVANGGASGAMPNSTQIDTRSGDRAGAVPTNTTQNIQVELSGNIVAKGSDLALVLDKEAQRVNAVT